MRFLKVWRHVRTPLKSRLRLTKFILIMMKEGGEAHRIEHKIHFEDETELI